MCELLSIAGAELEKSAKGKPRLEAAFRQLDRMSNATRSYPARIRFVIKDVLELRAQHWVARREVFTVSALHPCVAGRRRRRRAQRPARIEG